MSLEIHAPIPRQFSDHYPTFSGGRGMLEKILIYRFLAPEILGGTYILLFQAIGMKK